MPDKQAVVGFLRVRLLTQHGDIVRDLIIPPFETLPEVILWGARAFVKCSNPGLGTYREASSYAAPYDDGDDE